MEKASAQLPAPRCSLAEPRLDRFLRGGLPWGALVEWGVPWGQGGREFLLARLGAASRRERDARLLWVLADKHVTVYGPAWQALGVPLDRWRFVAAGQPLVELKPALMDPLFRFVVLDAPRSLSDEDMAFLSRQAREHRQIILVLRDGWLGEGRSNVFARLRINCRLEADHYRLSPVRGLPPGDLLLPRAPAQVPARSRDG